MVDPAAAPGSGLGTLPPDVEGCQPIVEVLLCQSQRGRQQFVSLPVPS